MEDLQGSVHIIKRTADLREVCPSHPSRKLPSAILIKIKNLLERLHVYCIRRSRLHQDYNQRLENDGRQGICIMY
jgi:hypothetical protein